MSHKPDPNKNVNLTINGIPVTVPEGTRILEAAKKVNVHIPVLCEHPNLGKRAVCRICVVECDGRGKLIAACANDVWEGVNIVTHNDRINSIRKMIIELLLANHPQDCLNCIRNTHCELQSLAQQFNIRKPPFRHDHAAERQPVTESNTLVRDMQKCVKCGRCVEACQELQTIRNLNSSHRSVNYAISSPYDQSLADGSCVFCGQCALVCPVGAIYEYDQSGEVLSALKDAAHKNAGCNGAVQISPSLAAGLDGILKLPAGTLSPGKLVSALKRLGFKKVYNADIFEAQAEAQIYNEILDRITKHGPNKNQHLPIISGYFEGCIKLVKDSFPDLLHLLSPCPAPRQIFAELIKTMGPQTQAVSIASIAHKFKYGQITPASDIVLTLNELARLFKLAGIGFAGLQETPFDIIEGQTAGALPAEIKVIHACGFAQARTALESIRRGECDADLVKITQMY